MCAPMAENTAPMGQPTEVVELPANSSATGLLPDAVHMSEPESPGWLMEPVITQFTNLATRVPYFTYTVALTPTTVPVVKPVVRPTFLSVWPTAGATTWALGRKLREPADSIADTLDAVILAIAQSTVFAEPSKRTAVKRETAPTTGVVEQPASTRPGESTASPTAPALSTNTCQLESQ